MPMNDRSLAPSLPVSGVPRGRRVRRGAAAVAVAASLALAACGYDPSTVGGQTQPTEAGAPSVDDAGTSAQMAAHLVADAEQLIRAADSVLADGGVSGETKSIAGELKGLMEEQRGRLSGNLPEGSAMVVEGEVAGVVDASGEDKERAFADLLRGHLPRMEQSWRNLEGSGDPAVADVAGDSVPRLAGLNERAQRMPGN